MPTDKNLINQSQDYELNDWLSRNGYRETLNNRNELKKIIPANSTWNDLDNLKKNHPSKFTKLEKK